MSNNKSVQDVIAYLDGKANNYGFSQKNYGLADEIANISSATPQRREAIVSEILAMSPDIQSALMPQIVSNFLKGNQMPNYTISPSIANKTNGKSTFMVKVSVVRAGTGSGNTFDPIFLFGGQSFNNSATPYLQVSNSGQVVTFAKSNGKNCVIFTYGAGANTTAYTVTLATAGEYPFILNSLTGINKMQVSGIQTDISDVSRQSQLTANVATFEFDEFGKAETNDLTTPRDLYQQSDSGIFIPHQFEISGSKGFRADILNIDGFSVNFYFFATPFKG